MAAGRLVERPLSLCRQEMVVAWTRERFLNLSIVDTLGWMWGHPVHCRMLTRSPGLYTPGASATPHTP